MNAARAETKLRIKPISILSRMANRIEQTLPSGRRQQFRRFTHPAWLAAMHRITPVSANWGYDRGQPIDRYYIDCFLASRKKDIHGCVLEIGEALYTRQFGEGVTQIDVLDNDPANTNATVFADLSHPDSLPSDTYDCILFTQVLQFIYPFQETAAALHRILRPSGVLLATLPFASKIDTGLGGEHSQLTDYWRFTPLSAQKLFADLFGESHVQIETYGSVLSTLAFLTGAAREDLSQPDLDARDPSFPLLIAVRAVKS